jgi:hypothetical protein
MNAVTQLKVDDEEFLVASLIDRCPKIMMLRELVQNAIEAAAKAPRGRGRVMIDTVEIDGARKLRIANSGPGMDEPQLHRMCDLAASIGKLKGLDQNFGLGAKVASLPSNHLGVRYRSCARGFVHEVTIGKRDGIYGRVRRTSNAGAILPGRSRLVDIVDVTAEARAEGYDLSADWTEVTLLGMRPDQETAADPYDGEPAMPAYWLAAALYNRFFRIPEDIDVQIAPELLWFPTARRFEPLASRAFTAFAGYEAVPAPGNVKIHFFHDPANPERPWENTSSDGALQTAASQVAIVYRNELYDRTSGSPWAYEAPNYGITFGARNISVFIELPDDYPLRPDAYRQFLTRSGGEQRQVMTRDFAALTLASRPRWLLDIINALGNQSHDGASVIDGLARLSSTLNLGALPEAGPESRASWAPAAVDNVNLSRARAALGFDIVLLTDEQDINDRWLLDRAGCFYDSTKQLFLNTQYPSVASARAALRETFWDMADSSKVMALIDEAAIDCLMTRVCRALLFAMAKHLGSDNWQSGHIEKAMSPETLSIAADDFHDLLPWAAKQIRAKLGSTQATESASTSW